MSAITRSEFLYIEKLKAEMNVEFAHATREVTRAASYGDLSENAEYDAAKEHRDRVVTRIEMLQESVKGLLVVDDEDIPTDTVSIGKTVVFDINGERRVFHIRVLPLEADQFSLKSPLGQVVVGKKVGDTFTLRDVNYRIVEILPSVYN